MVVLFLNINICRVQICTSQSTITMENTQMHSEVCFMFKVKNYVIDSCVEFSLKIITE